MTAKRPYRPAYDSDWAVAELHSCSGTQFDPEVVDAFVAALGAAGSALSAVAVEGSS